MQGEKKKKKKEGTLSPGKKKGKEKNIHDLLSAGSRGV